MDEKNAISVLQERMAFAGVALPEYTEEGFGTSFKCTVRAAGTSATGFGSSKKCAKHESARKILEKLNGSTTTSRAVLLKRSTGLEIPHRNYIGELNEFASKNRIQYPVYTFSTSDTGQFVCRCSFLGKIMLGVGNNKKDAKYHSAKNMVESMKAVKSVTSTEITTLQQTKIEVFDEDEINSVLTDLSFDDTHGSRANSGYSIITTKYTHQNNFETSQLSSSNSFRGLQNVSSRSNNLNDRQRAQLLTPTCSRITVKAIDDVKSNFCVLQEVMKTKGFSSPTQNITSYGIYFKCKTHAGGIVATAVALSKEEAQQNSARNALSKLKNRGLI